MPKQVQTKRRKKEQPPPKRHWPNVGRDSILFFFGLAGIFHETVIFKVERPYILGLFGMMVGLPAFIRADMRRQTGGKDDDEDE